MDIGIREIDDQHRVFVGLINEMFALASDPAAPADLRPFLRRLNGYAIYHFGTEEGYFERFGYESAEIHAGEHRRILKRISDFIEEYDFKGTAVIPELAVFLNDWFLDHTQKVDRQYVPLFQRHGL